MPIGQSHGSNSSTEILSFQIDLGLYKVDTNNYGHCQSKFYIIWLLHSLYILKCHHSLDFNTMYFNITDNSSKNPRQSQEVMMSEGIVLPVKHSGVRATLIVHINTLLDTL